MDTARTFSPTAASPTSMTPISPSGRGSGITTLSACRPGSRLGRLHPLRRQRRRRATHQSHPRIRPTNLRPTTPPAKRPRTEDLAGPPSTDLCCHAKRPWIGRFQTPRTRRGTSSIRTLPARRPIVAAATCHVDPTPATRPRDRPVRRRSQDRIPDVLNGRPPAGPFTLMFVPGFDQWSVLVRALVETRWRPVPSSFAWGSPRPLGSETWPRW